MNEQEKKERIHLLWMDIRRVTAAHVDSLGTDPQGIALEAAGLAFADALVKRMVERCGVIPSVRFMMEFFEATPDGMRTSFTQVLAHWVSERDKQ